ncbi:methyltransferase domain-containing protein [Phytoactinopolyspora limicola]|uniref:methyltransferase domain-containing protein n=1 Tax=Phytoactinopolyspora limicola TaxID=2715536 RepID=UPI00140E74BF
MNEERLQEFGGHVAGYLTGAVLSFAIWLGDELGLYRAMAGQGPMTADGVAKRSGCHPTLVRQWIDGQAAGGLVTYDGTTDTYELSPEAALTLADDTSPAFMARAIQAFGSLYRDLDKLADAYRGDGGLSWSDHDAALFEGTEWFFRGGYRAELPAWLAMLDGTHTTLSNGGRIADVGCGHGASCVVMAEAYPGAHVYGFDFHAASIEIAAQRCAEAGVADRTSFAVADAKSYGGTFDLICFFDCLHDMGDPVGIARYARQRLSPEGSVLLVEPFALDDRAANMTENPLAALGYTAGATVCTPNSLSQEVGLGLGPQAGEARLRAVFDEAGYSRFRRVAETPLNLILEAKP